MTAGKFNARVLLAGVLAIIAPLLVGCEAISERISRVYLEPSPPTAPRGVVAHRDIRFAGTPERDLYLDVYLPESVGDEPLPVILFLYGGGWEKGNRHQFRRFGLRDYPRNGFALVTADYRYLQEAVFPAQIEDVLSAIQWIRDSGDTYGLDANRIGVMGPSAGGHLAALAGTINRPEDAARIGAGLAPANVQAVVDYFGPTDFLAADEQLPAGEKPWSAPDSSVSRLIGALLKEAPEQVQLANPIAYVDGSEPPFLIIHGEADRIVPLGQSEMLQEALIAVGVDSELVIVTRGGHGFGGDFFTKMPAERTLAFFQRHLQDDN